MLMQGPPVARGWLNHLTGIRHNSSLPGDLREMVIMRIALVNGAPYEADQHAPIALKEGMTQGQLDALPDWESSSLFSAKARAVLAYTDPTTRDVQFTDGEFAAVKGFWDRTLRGGMTAR